MTIAITKHQVLCKINRPDLLFVTANADVSLFSANLDVSIVNTDADLVCLLADGNSSRTVPYVSFLLLRVWMGHLVYRC